MSQNRVKIILIEEYAELFKTVALFEQAKQNEFTRILKACSKAKLNLIEDLYRKLYGVDIHKAAVNYYRSN